MRLATRPLVLASLVVLCASCDFAWDDYDPRLQTSSSATGGGSSGGGGAGGVGGTGAGGVGGTAGQGGAGGVAPVCGDGAVEGDEECDDNNNVPDDGCDAACQVECLGGLEHPVTHHCYVLVLTLANWDNARQGCQDLGLGWDLVGLSTDAENQWVLGQQEIGAALANEDIWTSGTDRISEGVFEWANGEPWIFEGWHAGQPDDYDNAEDCLEVWRNSQSIDAWNDDSCSEASQYLCELAPPGP